MKVINCSECRKKIQKECEEAYLKQGYAFFSDSARTMAIYAICGALVAQVRRGRSKEYIQKLYEDMCFVFNTPSYFGKQITLTDIMNSLTRDYDIDFDKFEMHTETEKEFIRDARGKKK